MVTLAELRRVLEPHYVDRGVAYARDGKVVEVTWDPDTTSLFGHVQGSRARTYTTTADWVPIGGTLRFAGGRCSCPMVEDCKHVAALALAVVDAPVSRSRPAAPPAWRRTVEAWTHTPEEDIGAISVPLGIHLTLVPAEPGDPTSRGSLTARLVRNGPQGWVNGNLEWQHISTWVADRGYRRGPAAIHAFDAEHVRLARALHALSTTSSTGGYVEYTTRQLELASFPHPQLWPLMESAVEAGMPLRTGHRGADPVTLAGPADVAVDVTRAEDGGLALTAQVSRDGEAIQPLAFLGDPAHGIVAQGNGDGLVIAPLRRRVPGHLCTSALHGQVPVVPAAEVEEFLADGHLRLRQVVDVGSSDGSFAPPTVEGPQLVARLVPEQVDHLQLHWGWRYRIGATRREASVSAPLHDSPWRDPAAERRLMAGLVPLLGTDTFDPGRGLDIAVGLHGRTGALMPSTVLEGQAVIDFATDVLPGLQAHPDVEVEVIGGPLPDYRDVTDEVEVTVATRDIPEQRDWFDLDVALQVGEVSIPLGTVFTALAEGRTRLVLRSGAHLRLDTPQIDQLRELIEEAEALQERRSPQLKVSRYQVDLWEQLAALGIVTGQAQAWQAQVEALLADPTAGELAAPDGLAATLRPYQAEGYAWLSHLADHGLGGILADDMGLGKTVQALAMMLRRRQADPDAGPFLVLAPASVVHGWAAEAARFTPDLDVRVVGATFATLDTTAATVADGADVVVTSYTRFRLDADAYGEVAWSGLVLDEAQALKNHRSKLYGSVRRLGAPFAVAITGTPMENDLMELWSLLSIVAPGLFPNPSRFKEHYLTPIQRNRDAGRLATLRRRIRPLVLRRTKEEVATELPDKQEQVLEVDLTAAHRKVYDAWLQRERKKVLGLMGDLDEHRFTVLRSLTMLRLASLHAGLVEDRHTGMASAKLDALVAHLEEIVAGGHRALVFSQFTSFLARVRDRLDAAGIDHAYLDGSTRRREAVVESFREGDAPVFVISLKAGGVGLNLTEADYVFLLDPWWNPATEAQAIDRAHRIGQTRQVMVYRMIATGTIEEKVLDLSRRKADLVGRVMDQGRAFDGKLSAEDLVALFS